MKTYTIQPAKLAKASFRLSEDLRTLIAFAVIFTLYATVDGVADILFGGAL